MTKSILFVAIDYPPRPGPGANRNYYLHKHFSDSSWKSYVLAAKKSSHAVLDSSFKELDGVLHAGGKDATKVLSLFGKYPKFIEIPDRWYLWILPAFFKGRKHLKDNSTSFIYASFPTYSSAIVGALLSKFTKIPLILDLRDPFRFRYDPNNVPAHWLYKLLERFVIKQTKILITTTNECAALYKALYPELNKAKTFTIPNGFSADFHRSIRNSLIRKKGQEPFTLLHSGNLYQIGRDPSVLLLAIHQLVQLQLIKKGYFKLIFRGASPWLTLEKQIKKLHLDEFIEFRPNLSYEESIREMYSVDVNLLIQNDIFNLQIPSKLYDLVAINKPIIAITNDTGALAKEMQRLEVGYCSENERTLTEHIKNLLTKRIIAKYTTCDDNLSREKINARLIETLTKL